MKSASTALKAHLVSPVTTLARCWKIIRTDGVVFYFTTHDTNLLISGQTYLTSSGFSATAMSANSDMTVGSMDVQGVFDNEAITNADLRAGRFDYADVYVFLVNWADLTQGILQLQRGKLGEVMSSPQGWFKVELRGMTQVLQQRVIELYGPDCRADLGDHRCTIPIDPPVHQSSFTYSAGDYIKVATDLTQAPLYAQYQNVIYIALNSGISDAIPPTYDITVGDTTTDGTVSFKAVASWTRSATVDIVADNADFTVFVSESRAADGWYAAGVLTFETGNNAGASMEVKAWTQTDSIVQLYIPMPANVAPGDKCRISPGCNKSRETCQTKFFNLDNRRGEAYIPGNDQYLNYPDAN